MCYLAGRAGLADMQHSPSSLDDPEVWEVDCSLVLGESLRKDVGGHFLSGTIDHDDLLISYGLANEVIPDVDMFGACV